MLRSTALAVPLALLLTAPARAGLTEYVQKPDPAFRWELKGKSTNPLGTVYDLHLVSQVWQGITWEHGMQVYVPTGVTPNGTMVLWNQGGRPRAETAAFGLALAGKMKAPLAMLFGIPNQPLLGDRKEDALIAETFVRFLKTEDGDWPLLFPMAKSLVRAMDALEAFGRQEWKQPPTQFVVTGASKRGWTTWLTAVADKRVKAIAPLVIDTLNIPAQLPHQLEMFGAYSEMIGDYTRAGLVPLPDTAAARKLWQMVDPYSYRDRLTVPKFILNGANDPYWTVDALNLYWDGLQGDKWVCYVPNAGHNLQQKGLTGPAAVSRALDSLSAFARHQVHGTPVPRLEWKHDDADGRHRVTVTATPAPKAARLWSADNPTRDFRPAKWEEFPAQSAGGTITATVSPPQAGYRAFFVELDYDLDGLAYHLCTQIRVSGNGNGK